MTLEEPRHKLSESSPSGATQDMLNSFSSKLWQHVRSEIYREVHCRLRAQGFPWGLVCRYHLPSTYLNSRLLERKKASNMDLIICTDSLSRVSPSYQLGSGELYWNPSSGTSLVVQWLRPHASNAGGMSSVPGRGTKIPYTVRCGQKKKGIKIKGLKGKAKRNPSS